jgi:hypothetical protein
VECLTAEERRTVVEILLRVRLDQPKLDMPEAVIKEFLSPPASPAHCIFAKTTHTLSADFKTRVEPCQFGGDPDCSRCGCIASMGLAAAGHRKLVGPITAGHVFWASAAIGRYAQRGEMALQRFVNRKPGEPGKGGYHGISCAEDQLRVID